MPPVDAEFLSHVVNVHGEAGARWLLEIPRLLVELEQSWDLRIEAPYELSYNYVAAATSGSGVACVVKLTVPGSSGLAREAAALECFAGRGSVRLLARDSRRGALLLERADPGRPLAEWGPGRDSEATAILCSVMQRLWRRPPAEHALPSVADYGSDFADYDKRYGRSGPLPQALVDRASELLDQLSATAQRSVVLHGDLHHDNVLQARREQWLAIDPHGLVGDPGFDVGAMLYNPMTRTADELGRLLPGRLEQLGDLTELDPDRVVAWGLVMAVLSEVWNSEDDDEIDGRQLMVAQALAKRCQ